MKQDLKKICIAWEKLRILYNIILFVATIVTYLLTPLYLSATKSISIDYVRQSTVFFVLLPFLAISANLFYLFGASGEFYLYYLDVNQKWMRWAIFLIGIGGSAVIAVLLTLFSSHYVVHS